jgi:citrate lyase subunit beta/citryl-CoA lyase
VIGVKGIAGVFLPKVETRDEVIRWDGMIATLETARGLTVGATKLVLSIESALGVLNAYDMALGAARVASLNFGGAQDGDLNTDLGCVWSIDGPEMMHARCHTLLCARAARFDSPLDGVFANVRDPDGFEKDTALSRRLGYRGRKLIHPSQIEPCNRLYAPSERELDYYARVLQAFDTALARGSASTTVDGKMIDVAMANAARRALDEAAAWKKAGTG